MQPFFQKSQRSVYNAVDLISVEQITLDPDDRIVVALADPSLGRKTIESTAE